MAILPTGILVKKLEANAVRSERNQYQINEQELRALSGNCNGRSGYSLKTRVQVIADGMNVNEEKELRCLSQEMIRAGHIHLIHFSEVASNDCV